MSTSNVPSLEITSTGVSVPQTADVLTGVLSDLNNAFGGNLNITSPATPQGYLGENLTYYITNTAPRIASNVPLEFTATDSCRLISKS